MIVQQTNRDQLRQLGFQFIDSWYRGIHRGEICRNDHLTFILTMDKAFFESYISANDTQGNGTPIIEAAQQLRKEPDYLAGELAKVPGSGKYAPDRCCRVLLENYQLFLDDLANLQPPTAVAVKQRNLRRSRRGTPLTHSPHSHVQCPNSPLSSSTTKPCTSDLAPKPPTK